MDRLVSELRALQKFDTKLQEYYEAVKLQLRDRNKRDKFYRAAKHHKELQVEDLETAKVENEKEKVETIKAHKKATIKTSRRYLGTIGTLSAFCGTCDALIRTYQNEQERVSFHIDEQLQKRMDEEEYSFQPKSQNQDEAIDAWVMGCILGFVKFDKGNYWYQDFTAESLGNEKENWKNTGSAYRETAFEQFSSNEQLIKLYMDKFHTHIDDIGNLQAGELEKDVKDNYFRKYSRCQVTLKRLESSKEYIDTLKLIKKENEHRTSIFKN